MKVTDNESIINVQIWFKTDQEKNLKCTFVFSDWKRRSKFPESTETSIGQFLIEARKQGSSFVKREEESNIIGWLKKDWVKKMI